MRRTTNGSRKANVWILGILLLLLTGGLAQAEIITLEISGVITSASGSGLPASIYEDVTFTGTYTYDSCTLNTSDFDFCGQYVHDAPYGITLSLGGYEFKTTSNHTEQFEIGITNAVENWDYYRVISNENSPVDAIAIDSISWILGGPGSTISTFTLPDSEPAVLVELGDWASNTLEISGQNLLIQGTVTQVELIPEPLTGILMAVGVLYLRRRR
jgi:hypothetical protein